MKSGLVWRPRRRQRFLFLLSNTRGAPSAEHSTEVYQVSFARVCGVLSATTLLVCWLEGHFEYVRPDIDVAAIGLIDTLFTSIPA